MMTLTALRKRREQQEQIVRRQLEPVHQLEVTRQAERELEAKIAELDAQINELDQKIAPLLDLRTFWSANAALVPKYIEMTRKLHNLTSPSFDLRYQGDAIIARLQGRLDLWTTQDEPRLTHYEAERAALAAERKQLEG